MPNTTSTNRIEVGSRVTTWDGKRGTVIYQASDVWYGVRVDNERGHFEWQASQLASVEAVRP